MHLRVYARQYHFQQSDWHGLQLIQIYGLLI